MPKILICYRRKDSEYAAPHIYDALCGYFGHESVIFDIDSIPLGVDFREYLNDQISQCDVVLVVIGDKWVEILNEHPDDEPDHVRTEIELALKRGIPVVPVLVGEASIPKDSELPKEIAALAWRNAAVIRGGPNLRLHLDRLVDRLKKELTGQAAERQAQDTWSRPVTGRKVNKGLARAFTKFETARPKDDTKTAAEIKVPADFRYTYRHAWLSLANDIAIVGMTAFPWSVRSVVSTTIRYLKDIGEEVLAGDLVVALDLLRTDPDPAAKMLKDETIYVRAPVSGEIRDHNKKLRRGLFSSGEDLIQDDPYGDGWAFRMRVDARGEIETQQLMDAQEYRKYLREPEFDD